MTVLVLESKHTLDLDWTGRVFLQYCLQTEEWENKRYLNNESVLSIADMVLRPLTVSSFTLCFVSFDFQCISWLL